jgi:hypothetical protein
MVLPPVTDEKDYIHAILTSDLFVLLLKAELVTYQCLSTTCIS